MPKAKTEYSVKDDKFAYERAHIMFRLEKICKRAEELDVAREGENWFFKTDIIRLAKETKEYMKGIQ